MGWWGKVLGGALGYLMGGPLGALAGVAVGHGLDVDHSGGKRAAAEHEAPPPGDRERVQTAFFTAAFSVMGHVAKADGRVSEDEIRMARSVMRRLALDEEQKAAAIRLFNEGKRPGFPLNEVLAQFKRESHRRRNLLRLFLEVLIQAAYADGRVDPAERLILSHVAGQLGFGEEEFAHLESSVNAAGHFAGEYDRRRREAEGRELAAAYAALDVDDTASDEEVKRAYRRLMSQHHPDKLVSKGLPEEMMKIAAERTHEIKAAYEQIRKARGF